MYAGDIEPVDELGGAAVRDGLAPGNTGSGPESAANASRCADIAHSILLRSSSEGTGRCLGLYNGISTY